jgi:acyl carrier protein
MNDIEILKNLLNIFKDVMEDENLIIDKSFTAKDIDGWDSLTHIMLIFEIEKNFDIKFLSSEMTSWSNIGEIVMSIKSKL